MYVLSGLRHLTGFFWGLSHYWGNDRCVFDKRDQTPHSDTSAFIPSPETQHSLCENNNRDKHLLNSSQRYFTWHCRRKPTDSDGSCPTQQLLRDSSANKGACQSAPPLPSQVFHNANPLAIPLALVKGLYRTFKHHLDPLPPSLSLFHSPSYSVSYPFPFHAEDKFVTFSPCAGILWWLVANLRWPVIFVMQTFVMVLAQCKQRNNLKRISDVYCLCSLSKCDRSTTTVKVFWGVMESNVRRWTDGNMRTGWTNRNVPEKTI